MKVPTPEAQSTIPVARERLTNTNMLNQVHFLKQFTPCFEMLGNYHNRGKIHEAKSKTSYHTVT